MPTPLTILNCNYIFHSGLYLIPPAPSPFISGFQMHLAPSNLLEEAVNNFSQKDGLILSQSHALSVYYLFPFSVFFLHNCKMRDKMLGFSLWKLLLIFIFLLLKDCLLIFRLLTSPNLHNNCMLYVNIHKLKARST